VVTHFRKIVYSQWLVKPEEWLTNGYIDAFQNLIYERYKYQGFSGFIHPSRFEPSSIGRDFILNPDLIHDRPFVTILNAGKNHWITLTNYDPHWVNKADGTYTRLEKSSNNEFPYVSYSLQKFDHLIKPFILCCADGYFIDCYGPFRATLNDADILKYILATDKDLKELLIRPKNIYLFLDRGKFSEL
jgi:hypothetical protein